MPALTGAGTAGLARVSAPHAEPTDTPIVLLFLVADTGGGHRASATAVAGELAAAHPGRFLTHILDPFIDASPPWVGRVVRLYSPLTRHAPWLWGALYHATDSAIAVKVLQATLLRRVEPGLSDVVATLQPAVVVSFHPLLNHLSAQARRRRGWSTPLVTVVTDLVDVHAAWTCAEVDAVIAASPAGRDRCRRAGIPAERCLTFGLPVDSAFSCAAGASAGRAALRCHLGIDADRFTVLLSGGGEGSGGLLSRAKALLNAGLSLQLVAICGRNVRLAEQLRALPVSPDVRLVVQGFVDNMAEWMRCADVVVSKAGPQTIAEALCSGVPLLLTSHLPGQERGNVDYVVSTGAGRYVPRVSDLVDAVAELAAPGSPALAAMRQALSHVARPAAAAQVAQLLAELATTRAISG
jgi:1,2-diacylglycerol 3-beta-galactosyltransferase